MIELQLTIEEVNTILASLGRQPYEAVFKVVANLQNQAAPQVAAQQAANPAPADEAKVVDVTPAA